MRAKLKRRAVISLLGGAAAWPLAARAQPPERMRRIGVLSPQAAEDPESQARITAFAQGMQESGWIVGRNVQIAGDADKAAATARNEPANGRNRLASAPARGKELRALRRLQREPPSGARTAHVFVSERLAPLSVAGYQRMVARTMKAARALLYRLSCCRYGQGRDQRGRHSCEIYPRHGVYSLIFR